MLSSTARENEHKKVEKLHGYLVNFGLGHSENKREKCEVPNETSAYFAVVRRALWAG